MPQDLIATLGERGREAGALLASRFTPAWNDPNVPELSWDNHRWLRYRTALATIEPFLSKLLKGWLDEQTLRQLFPGYDPAPPPPGQRTYAQIAAAPADTDTAALDAAADPARARRDDGRRGRSPRTGSGRRGSRPARARLAVARGRRSEPAARTSGSRPASSLHPVRRAVHACARLAQARTPVRLLEEQWQAWLLLQSQGSLARAALPVSRSTARRSRATRWPASRPSSSWRTSSS